MNQPVQEKTRETRDVVITLLVTPTEASRLRRACELTYDQSQSAFCRIAMIKEIGRVEAEHGIDHSDNGAEAA